METVKKNDESPPCGGRVAFRMLAYKYPPAPAVEPRCRGNKTSSGFTGRKAWVTARRSRTGVRNGRGSVSPRGCGRQLPRGCVGPPCGSKLHPFGGGCGDGGFVVVIVCAAWLAARLADAIVGAMRLRAVVVVVENACMRGHDVCLRRHETRKQNIEN